MGCLIFFTISCFAISLLVFVFGGSARQAGFIYLILGMILGAVYLIIEANKKNKENSEARRAREEQIKADEMARQKRNLEYHNRMVALGTHSIDIFESMPNLLSSAEEQLNQADLDYTDSAFAPFWDSVEKAAKALGYYDEGIEKINSNSSEYTGLVKQFEGNPPGFPLSHLSVIKLEVGKVTAERMQSIVRKAQRNFQFAMIYEQRKTNQILVAGFTSLAHALNEMTQSITSAIDDLAISVDGMSSNVNRIGQKIDSISETTKEYIEEQAAREERTIEMLDNIQRGRKPFETF